MALYYTIADIVLLVQCFYYRGFTLSDNPTKPTQDTESAVDDTAPLLQRPASGHSSDPSSALRQYDSPTGRRRSSDAIREHLASLDGVHFSPATPMHGAQRDAKALVGESPVQNTGSKIRTILYNAVIVIVVCVAGVGGWFLTNTTTDSGHHGKHRGNIPKHHAEDSTLEFNVLAQVFGYICTVFYLGSRVPQLLLNYRRKSTDGLSILFFLFACIGNATYVLSIFLYEAPCVYRAGKHAGCAEGEEHAQYMKYVLVNLSWIIGSLGTLFLDAGVFVQYFIYSKPTEAPS